MTKLMLLVLFGFTFTQQAGGATPSWACALKPCVLNSALASAGPAFNDIMSFNAMGAQEKSTQQQCPFGGNDGIEASKGEWKQYMKGLDKVGDMSSPAERREWAIKKAAEAEKKIMEPGYVEEAERRAFLRAQEDQKKLEAMEREKIKPSVDVSTPGIEAVGSISLDQLRKKKEYDLLVIFYAPWCPHCKAFVTDANAPITTLSANLETAHGPKVVTFDATASRTPYDLQIDSVPSIYLIRKTGQSIAFKEDPHNLERLVAFALGEVPKPAVLLAKSMKHLKSIRHLHSQTNQSQEPESQSKVSVGPGEEQFVEPEKDFQSVGGVVQATVMQPPKNTPASEELVENNTTDEFVEPDKDFHTFAVVHSGKEESEQEQPVLLAKSTHHVRSLTHLRGHANRSPEPTGSEDEYVEPEKAFHSVGVEEYVTVVKPPPASSPKVEKEHVLQNSTEEFEEADKDFQSFGVVHGLEELKQDQAFHVVGAPEEYVSPDEAFHPVNAKEEYLTVTKPAKSA